jgi:hypothetical protein
MARTTRKAGFIEVMECLPVTTVPDALTGLTNPYVAGHMHSVAQPVMWRSAMHAAIFIPLQYLNPTSPTLVADTGGPGLKSGDLGALLPDSKKSKWKLVQSEQALLRLLHFCR